MAKILVTGASGFIAQHIVKLAVSKHYSVVGTVRLSAKGEKLKQNLDTVNQGLFEFVVVRDMSTPGCFDEVFERYPDISIVLHTASPYFYDSTDPETDLILPAINGTKSVLESVKKQVDGGNTALRRLVVTSSDAALYSAKDEQNAALSFNEENWNNISYEDAIKDPISAYYGAKSFAEKLAWQYYRSNANFPTLSTVNPVYVFGPQAFANEISDKLNTSNEMVHGLMKLKTSETFSNDKGGYVDVRDVARAHLAAFERLDTKEKRLYMTNGHFSVQMMLDVINDKFPQLQCPKGTPGSGPADISTLAATSNQATRELLKFDFIPLEECVCSIVQQVLDYRESKPTTAGIAA